MRVAIVDDVVTNIMVLSEVVRRLRDCSVISFTDPLAALAEIRAGDIDLILVDYRMPEMNGVEFIRQVRAIPKHADVPIVMVTTSSERDLRISALDAGATDFLTKPIDVVEVKSRLTNMVKLRESQNSLRDKANWLEQEVLKATSSLAAREEEIIFRLSRAAESRDGETGTHILRMAKYGLLIAEALGLDRETCRNWYLAAPMHDVGKIAVSDAILLKPDRLTTAERSSMQEHARRGYEILDGSDSPLIRLAAEIALTHHERWDGAGYPRGLQGADIPLFGRIAAVADVFDALTSVRPYKAAWPTDRARAYIVDNSGTQFDPDCVAAFLSRWPDVLRIYERNVDRASSAA